ILTARADRMAVIRRIVAGLSDNDLGRPCRRSPAPGYPEEEQSVADCLAVVMDEEIEHYRFAVRDLAVLESGSRRLLTHNLTSQPTVTLLRASEQFGRYRAGSGVPRAWL